MSEIEILDRVTKKIFFELAPSHLFCPHKNCYRNYSKSEFFETYIEQRLGGEDPDSHFFFVNKLNALFDVRCKGCENRVSCKDGWEK
jgi:hypothetical protein